MALTSDLLERNSRLPLPGSAEQGRTSLDSRTFSGSTQNSALPETQAFAEKYASVVGTAPTFYVLTVIEEMRFS